MCQSRRRIKKPRIFTYIHTIHTVSYTHLHLRTKFSSWKKNHVARQCTTNNRSQDAAADNLIVSHDNVSASNSVINNNSNNNINDKQRHKHSRSFSKPATTGARCNKRLLSVSSEISADNPDSEDPMFSDIKDKTATESRDHRYVESNEKPKQNFERLRSTK